VSATWPRRKAETSKDDIESLSLNFALTVWVVRRRPYPLPHLVQPGDPCAEAVACRVEHGGGDGDVFPAVALAADEGALGETGLVGQRAGQEDDQVFVGGEFQRVGGVGKRGGVADDAGFGVEAVEGGRGAALGGARSRRWGCPS